MRNIGHETLRVVGVFAGVAPVHRFFAHLPGDASAVIVHGPQGEEVLAATPMAAPVSA